MTKLDVTSPFKPDYDGDRPKTTLTGPERQERLLAGNLAYLMALEANGLERPAKELVGKIDAALRRKPKAAPIEPADRVTLPDNERGRSEYDLKRLDRINARLARGYKPHRGKTVEEQREEDLRRRAELEREISHKAEEQARLLAEAESDILAAKRGETVEVERSGLRRVLERDPLLSLARVGKLTAQQLETGQEVRDLYDLRAADAGAVEYTGMPSVTHNHEWFVAKRFERAKACEMVGRIERTVAVKLTAEPVALAMIRAVCERGHSLTSQGKGRAYERNAKALARALDVAEDVLRRRL